MKSTTGGGQSVAQNPVLLQLNTSLAQYKDSSPPRSSSTPTPTRR